MLLTGTTLTYTLYFHLILLEFVVFGSCDLQSSGPFQVS